MFGEPPSRFSKIAGNFRKSKIEPFDQSRQRIFPPEGVVHHPPSVRLQKGQQGLSPLREGSGPSWRGSAPDGKEMSAISEEPPTEQIGLIGGEILERFSLRHLQQEPWEIDPRRNRKRKRVPESPIDFH